MADLTEGDTEVTSLGQLTVALIGLIPGLVIHSFIIAVNVNDWWKGRLVTDVDHIIISLGISRICIQFVSNVYLLSSSIFFGSLDSLLTLGIIDILYVFFIFVNVWLTALLSTVLCLKISNHQSRLFLYLKRMILQRTAYFIVASVLLSAFNTLIPFLIAINEVNNDGKYNTIWDLFFNCSNTEYAYNYATGASGPLLFYCISSILLFSSLYHHTTRMKRSSNLTINLETYYSVMRFVSFTFIYNTIYFIAIFVYVFCYYLYSVNLSWLHIVFIEFLPVLHSCYLIYKTAKLRNQMPKVLQSVIFFLFQRKDTETRENIEIEAR